MISPLSNIDKTFITPPVSVVACTAHCYKELGSSKCIYINPPSRMAEASKGYVSLFDLGESKDDAEVDYSSLYMHHYRVGDT